VQQKGKEIHKITELKQKDEITQRKTTSTKEDESKK